MRNSLSYLEPVSHPVLFNAWKHHLRYLQAILLMARERGAEVLDQHINKIGHNMMDVYTGDFTPQQISEKIISELQLNGITDAHKYRIWLIQQNKGYTNLKIEDQSLWTLLLGKGKIYIHIHPARHSPCSIRVKALTLKSAIWISFELLRNPHNQINLDFINSIRKIRLQASPIKSVDLTDNLINLVRIMLGF